MLTTGTISPWLERGFRIVQLHKDFINGKYVVELDRGLKEVAFIPVSQIEYEEILHETMLAEPKITGDEDNEYA